MSAILLVGNWDGETNSELAARGYDLEHVPAPQDAPALVDDVDAAVVRTGERDLATVEALADASADLPIVYAAEPEAAGRTARALDAGATDTVVLGASGTSRLVRRVATHVDRPPGGGDGEARTGRMDRAATAELDRAAAAELGDSRVRAILEAVQELLEAPDQAAVADGVVRAAERVLGYEIVAVQLLGTDGETLVPANVSAAGRDLVGPPPTVRVSGSSVEPVVREERTVHLDDAALDRAGFEPLVSALVVPLGGHGTLCFGSVHPDAFDERDRRLAELLAANAAVALDRIDRIDRIERLHLATQAILDRRSPEAVAERVVEAVESIMGYRFAEFHLLDDDGEALEPAAWTAATEERFGEPTPILAGRGGPWLAFETREMRHYGRSEPEASQGPSPYEAQLHVPVGDHGLLVVASLEPRVFDDTDRQLAQLLATNTARTLDRVARTEELERYESVFETVSDMVYVLDEDGTFTLVTPALADQFGYDRDALVGRHVSAVIDDSEALSRAVDLVQELLGDDPDATRTQRLDVTTADDEEVPVEVEVCLLPGEGFRGIVGVIRDVSDLVAARERLDSQQNRFEYLFEHIPDPVVETNLESGEATVVSVNEAFEETFGFEAEAVVDRPIDDVIVPEEHRERAASLGRRTAEGEIVQTALERETRYGVREFLYRGVPYTAADGTTRAFAIYTDITDQRERERHLEVLQRVLRHNVRNDVNVLLGGIEDLEAAGADPETLATLEETAEGLLAMSRKAKRIGRVLQAGREQRATVDLAAQVGRVVERYRAADVEATIHANLPETAPIAGSHAIGRAVEDLVGNAVEHAGAEPRVEVTVERGEDRTTVTVADDGPGIPEEERRVLEEAEITPLRHGSGLGLWLVKHATAASGGTVSFDERPDGGACVRLSFRTAEVAS